MMGFIKILKARRDQIISRNAARSLRADHENLLALAGNPAGVHGVYLPTYLEEPHVGGSADPVTTWIDVDDGFKDWK